VSSTFWLDDCESTQDLAWAAPSPTSDSGSFWVALEQTRGRGRGADRFWHSPVGGLYVSWRLHVNDPNGLALLGGLAVARCLQTFGLESWLKWPNDCWVGKGKIAGVLPDCRWRGQQCVGAVLGIGLNVQIAAEHLPAEAVSMHQFVRPCPSVREVWESLRQQLVALLEVHRRDGLAGYLEDVRSLSIRAGTRITYRVQGEERPGVVQGLDELGRLVLQSGEVLSGVERLRVLQ
jgi:BirA family transcriptional regulator, biotin operon repressor / biotin---[acetyl-CoA-carboxylase] ligase